MKYENQEEEFMQWYNVMWELSPMALVLLADSPNFGWVNKMLLWTFLVLVSISSAEA